MIERFGSFIVAMTLMPYLAHAESLPPTAKKATMAEFQAFADGKPVTVDIFDLGAPITAKLVWDWKSKRITGTALLNKTKTIDVKSKLSFKGGKACAASPGEKPSCHLIYIDADRFYEVNEDGSVHAMSRLGG